MSAEIKPCPFCGEDRDLDNCNGFITCGNCEAQGPSTLPSDHEGAESKWNDRRGPEAAESKRLRAALEFYAAPETYSGIEFSRSDGRATFAPGPGPFWNDIESVGPEKAAPGDRARNALEWPSD